MEVHDGWGLRQPGPPSAPTTGARTRPAADCRWRCGCAGGRVHGAEVRKISLLAAGGETAEDDIGESGVALVLAVGPFAQPWTVELYDAAGGLLRSHPFSGGRSS